MHHIWIGMFSGAASRPAVAAFRAGSGAAPLNDETVTSRPASALLFWLACPFCGEFPQKMGISPGGQFRYNLALLALALQF